jgi:hypothetical protein
LPDIVVGVKRVSDIIAEISAAGEEQSVGFVQINRAVEQMDGATQQNAALVEQASAAAKSMEHQAQELVALTRFFDVEATATPTEPPVEVPAAKTTVGAPARAVRLVHSPRVPAVHASGNNAVWQDF